MSGTGPWVAQDNVEPIASATIQAIANSALYNVLSGVAGTYNAGNLQITYASGSVTHNGTVTSVAGNSVTLVADPTNPRWTYSYVNSSGVAAIVSGTAAAKPAVPDPGANVTVQLTYVQAGLTIASNATYQLDKRVMSVTVPVDAISATAQYFVESSGYKGFSALGAPPLGHTYADADLVGAGFAVRLGGTGSAAPSSASDANDGTWLFSTGTTNASDAGVIGPPCSVANDWTFVWRGKLGTGANQNIIIGASASSTDFADANNLIAFRVSGTGTIQGVCDNGGSETTRDTSVTPDGTTECTLRIEVRSGGTIVRFYKDNVQVGADVTTNIFTNALRLVIGVDNGASGANRTIRTADAFGWREN